MPITFSPEYYSIGKDAALKFPELDKFDRERERQQQYAFAREQRNFQQKREDRKWLEEMMSLDPVTALSTKNATDQAQWLEEYNKKWASRYQQAKGELSEADRLEMIKDKSFLQAKQKKVLSDQQQVLNALETVQRDTRGYYDKDKFKLAYQNYLKTGEVAPDMLDIAPQSMTGWLRGQSKTLPAETVSRKEIVGGIERIVDTPVISKESAQRLIAEGLGDEARLKQVIMDFDKWTQTAPQEEVYALLKDYDTNKDGIIDPAERQYAYGHIDARNNPIVQWALNNPDYIESATGTKEGASKALSTGKKGGFTMEVNVGGGTVKMTPGSQIDNEKSYGDRTYSKPYSFNNTTAFVNVSTDGAIKLKGMSSVPLNRKGSVRAQLLDYDPEKDVLIVRSVVGNNNLNLESQDVLEIPADNLQNVNNIPIMVDGKPSTVGAIRGNRTAPAEKPQVNIGL